MNDLATRAAAVEALGQALEAEFPPIHIETEHHLHAGMYSRTVYVPKGAAVVGLTVKVPTQLICCGHFRITDGGVTKELRGVHILDGMAGRRAAVYALEN